jgi:hypothetical protein
MGFESPVDRLLTERGIKRYGKMAAEKLASAQQEDAEEDGAILERVVLEHVMERD